MGLGKTIQTIAFFAYLIEYKSIKRPFLIITPKSTVPNWLKEFKFVFFWKNKYLLKIRKWLPDVRTLFLSGIREEKEEALISIKKKAFDVVITTYEGCKNSFSNIRNISWEYLVIDEGHKIKNEESIIAIVWFWNNF